ncbi:MAG TPA: toll/interleukin-1 receptor domain-containing protein [Thermoanaerobaculia bacterium]|nr:toll/interleukin-1 receptor domain-containing protein [Thermoanaerobaculia bacterium]
MKAFISYAAADREWARQFHQQLEASGVEAWLDVHELFPGDNWQRQIGDALESSDVLLALVSPASVRSESVQRETQFALGSERFENRIVPVIVEPTDEMPWIFRRFKTVSGSPAEAARQVAALLAATSPEGSAARAHSR